MANRHMKRWSTTFVSRELHIKIMRYHLLKLLQTKKLTMPNTNEDAEQHSLLVGMQNDITTLEDSLAVCYKAKHNLPIKTSNPTPGYLPK